MKGELIGQLTRVEYTDGEFGESLNVLKMPIPCGITSGNG